MQLQRTWLKDLDYSTASRGAKYNHALCLLKDIGDLIAECGSEEFTRRMDLKKKLKAMWMANKTVELWNSDCSESDEDFTREPGMHNPGASPEECYLQQQSSRSRHITPAMSCPTSNMVNNFSPLPLILLNLPFLNFDARCKNSSRACEHAADPPVPPRFPGTETLTLFLGRR